MGDSTSIYVIGTTATWLSAASGSPGCEIRPEEEGMAEDAAKSIWREKKAWLRRDPEIGHAARASTKDCQGYW